MCFVLAWCIGLFARAIVEALSHITSDGVGTTTLRSFSKHFNQDISQVQSAKALYSASVDDLDTTDSFLDCQDMRM